MRQVAQDISIVAIEVTVGLIIKDLLMVFIVFPLGSGSWYGYAPLP